MSYPLQGKEIDNDYHPVDSDLSATNDHWGTKLAGDVTPLRPGMNPANTIGEYMQKINQSRPKGNDDKTNVVPIRGPK